MDNNSNSEDEEYDFDEYLINNCNDDSDNSSNDEITEINSNFNSKSDYDSDSDSDSELKSNSENEYKSENENENDNENESILLLSSDKTIKDNKIIYTKKIMINAITNNFTNDEILIINSIFNYNSELLLLRNKILNEYILIMVILNYFNIEIMHNTIKIFPEIPWNKKYKKYKKSYNEILSNYNFKKFVKNNKCKKKDIKKPKNLIKAIINGFVFYIKNITLFKQEIFTDKKEELENFKKIILKNENAVFCTDENLQCISSWLSNLVKRILIFNFSLFLKQEKMEITLKQNIEEEVYIILNIIFYLILTLNDEKKLKANNMDKKKLKRFLIFNYQNTFIQNILENEIFIIIINYIYKNKNSKIFLCKKKYLEYLQKNFL